MVSNRLFSEDNFRALIQTRVSQILSVIEINPVIEWLSGLIDEVICDSRYHVINWLIGFFRTVDKA